jgi:methylmalonyl-CoA mutase N-terminal domain/subunit
MADFTDKAQAFAKCAHKDLGDTGLIEAATAAARADATTGEIMGVLKDALGWSAPHEY